MVDIGDAVVGGGGDLAASRNGLMADYCEQGHVLSSFIKVEHFSKCCFCAMYIVKNWLRGPGYRSVTGKSNIQETGGPQS